MQTTDVPNVSIDTSLGQVDRTLANCLRQNGFHTLRDLYKIPEASWMLIPGIPNIGKKRLQALRRWIEYCLKDTDAEQAPWMLVVWREYEIHQAAWTLIPRK